MENANADTQLNNNTNDSNSTTLSEKNTPNSFKKKTVSVSQPIFAAMGIALCIFILASGILLVLLIDRFNEIDNLKKSCTGFSTEQEINPTDISIITFRSMELISIAGEFSITTKKPILLM